MTVAAAAALLEVSPWTIYDLCRAGLLAHHRVGVGRGVIRIDRADVEAYLCSRRVEARQPERAEPAPKHGSARGRHAGPVPKKDHY